MILLDKIDGNFGIFERSFPEFGKNGSLTDRNRELDRSFLNSFTAGENAAVGGKNEDGVMPEFRQCGWK